MSDNFYFTFTHNSDDGNWEFSKNYPYGTSWDTVLTDFLSFMSGVYGYNIAEKVNYRSNPVVFKGHDE